MNQEIGMKIDHIGYLCEDIEKSIVEFESLGYKKISDIYLDDKSDNGKARNVYICFMQNEVTRIELVSPMNEQSDVNGTLERQGEGPYHICYRVENLGIIIEKLKSKGYMILKRPAEAIAFSYSEVAFMYKKGIGIIELVEKKDMD